MNLVEPTFRYARDGGTVSYTGKFEITIEELKNGYRCGKIIHADGSIFIGKYYEDINTGKTKMVEGNYVDKSGKIKSLGRFWENKLSDGMVIEEGKPNGRVLPYD